MANKAHLDRVKKGVTAWNEWRQRAPEERPELSNAPLSFGELADSDFSEANLWEANLKKADLKGANLKGAELSFTDLSGADLSGADLSGANLTEVNLSGAVLKGARLQGVNGWGGRLEGADLTDADLTDADLSDANLRQARMERTRLVNTVLGKADLSGVVLSRTLFGNVDLSRVRGLGTVVHETPSMVATDTLERSGTGVPADFLQKAGVTPAVIQALRGTPDAPAPPPTPSRADGTAIRSLLLDRSGGHRFPDGLYTIITESNCPLYGAADRFRLSGCAVSVPPEKAACAILIADILGILRRAGGENTQGVTFRCSGCVGRVRLARGEADALPAEGKLSREMEGLIKLLNSFPMFKDLTPPDIQYCLTFLRLGKYKEGDVLLKKGDSGRHLYIILSGRVEVVGEEDVSIAQMGRGEVFGEMSLLSGRVVAATIRVMEPARIVYLQASDFRHLLLKFPSLQLYFNRLLVQRLSEIHDVRSRELASGVVGKLSDMPPAELLQTLNINQKTGVLRLKLSGTAATVSFRDGAMVDAKYDQLSGRAAFYEILKETDGRFKFVPGLSEEEMAAEEMGDFMGMLMEGLKQIDETGGE